MAGDLGLDAIISEVFVELLGWEEFQPSALL